MKQRGDGGTGLAAVAYVEPTEVGMSVAAKAKTTGMWMLTILLCVMFALAGSVKFDSSEIWPRMFSEWGYPDGFVYVIGGIEVIAALVLLIPALAAYAAMVIAVLMFGAATTHLLHDRMFMFDVVIMLLAPLLAWVRRPLTRALGAPVQSAS